MNVNIPRSMALAEMVGAEVQMCYVNALKGMFALEVKGIRSVYVEGWASEWNNPIPVQHGWLVCEGEILDPTWLDDGMKGHFYTPSVEFTMQDVSWLLDRRGNVKVPLIDYALTGDVQRAARHKNGLACKEAIRLRMTLNE